MNELDMLNKELQDINAKQIRLQTIIDQAKQQCKEIELKYNIKDENELKNLLDEANTNYTNKITEAAAYLADAKQKLSSFEGIL